MGNSGCYSCAHGTHPWAASGDIILLQSTGRSLVLRHSRTSASSTWPPASGMQSRLWEGLKAIPYLATMAART